MVRSKKIIIRLFYNIWADIIVRYRKQHPDDTDGQIRYVLMFYVSTVNAMSIWQVFSLFELFGLIKIHWIRFDIFPTERLNSGLSTFFMFVFPCMLINYFLIFWRKRYIKIIDVYATEKGNYGDIYLKTVLITVSILVFGYGIISGNIFKW
ncbi:MAG: hypothetical protein WCJ61_17000 [Paludibacter sp.]